MTLAAIAAALYLIAIYGTALLSTPFAAVPLNGPVTCDSDGQMTAIVDTESRRMLILNPDGDITGVVDCTTFDSPFEAITDVCVSDGLVYAAGAKFRPGSTEVALERVAVYDKGGNYLETVFENKDGNMGSCAIKGLEEADGGVSVCLNKTEFQSDSTALSTALTFVFVNLDGTRVMKTLDAQGSTVFGLTYNEFIDDYVILDSEGKLYKIGEEPRRVEGRVLTAIDLASSGTIFACDDVSGSICALSPDGSTRNLAYSQGFEDVSSNNGFLCFNDRDADTVILCHDDGQELWADDEFKPSFGFSLRMLLMWASALYLAILAIAFAARRARKGVAEGRTQAIGPLFAAGAVVAALGVAIGVLSQSSYQSSLEMQLSEVNMSADYLSLEVPGIGEEIEQIGGRDELRNTEGVRDETLESMMKAGMPPMWLAYSANSNGIGLYAVVYGKDDEGIFYLADSENEHVAGTRVHEQSALSVLEGAFANDEGALKLMHDGRLLRDVTKYRLVGIPSSKDDGNVGVIEIGVKVRAFESSFIGSQAQILLALLAIMLVVYLAYSEIRACASCLYTYHKRQEQRARDAVAALTRPFTFGITMLTSVDAVMTVLIARDLLTAAGMDQAGTLLALPAIMQGVGLVAGQLLYGRLAARTGMRRLMSAGSIAMLVCALAAVAAVAWGGYWPYCAAKLFMAVPFGLLYALGYSMPRIAESDEVARAAAGGVKRTDTSAAALGTVIGGYAAQALGNEWVYVLVAIACIPVIMMAVSLLPKGAGPMGIDQPKRGAFRNYFHRREAFLLPLLVVLPVTLAAGYASFVFPIFSADLGMSKSQVNNVFVLGQLVAYICIGSIERLEADRGKWRVTVGSVALLGAVFLLFSLNTTLVWSFAVVAIVAVLAKSTDGWKTLCQRSAIDAGMSPDQATATMLSTRSAAFVIQPLILGMLVSATDSVTVIVIGSLCVLCAAVYYLASRRTPTSAL